MPGFLALFYSAMSLIGFFPYCQAKISLSLLIFELWEFIQYGSFIDVCA
jgi:hypothetical protein